MRLGKRVSGSLFRGILWACLLAVSSINVSGADAPEAGLLFSADFDAWSVNADYAAGEGRCRSFENPDLQLRMFPGINGKGNSLSMDNRESAIYGMPGNFDPRQGTVSLWVSPRDWRVNDGKWQIFFEAFQKDFRMLVYKYLSPNLLIFYIQIPGADGKNQVFMARTMIEDQDWQSGSWHKLDVTWNSEGMKLYVDGVMPKVYNKNNQRRIPWQDFTTPPSLPQAAKDGIIVLGINPRSQKNPATDPGRKTAYDEVKIYDRPLSPEEIRKAYEKHFPPKAAREELNPLASIPLSSAIPKIDGLIDAKEWSDAGAVPIARFGKIQLPGSCPEAVAYFKYDHENIYVAMRSSRPWINKKHSGHDANIWEDDSFELLLFDNNGNTYHLIVNGNGAVFDERNSDKSWNSGARAAASGSENSRAIELALPLSALPGFKAGGKWKGNFCATYYQPNGKGVYSGWSQMMGGSYDNIRGFGELLIVPDNAAIRLLSLGRPSAGRLSLDFDATLPTLRDRFSFTGLCDGESPIILSPGKPWNHTVPGGSHVLRFQVADKQGKECFRYDYPFSVDNPLTATHACYYLRKVIEMKIDMNNSGGDNIAKLRNGGLKGRVELRDNSGKPCSSVDFTATDVISMVSLPFPTEFPSGAYEIVSTVESVDGPLESSSPFIVPDMTPYREKVAADHNVPPPWTPVRQTGTMSFAVLDREYVWSGSPFPSDITTMGEKILSSPIVMRCNGAPVKWNSFEIVQSHEDFIGLSGRGKAGDLNFTWRGELWYDGAYKLNLDMEPANTTTTVKSLDISWTMPRKCAEFVLNPLLIPWDKDKRVSIGPAPEMTATSREHLFWLTGHRLGLAWWPESKANWFNNTDEKPISAAIDGDQVKVELKLISRTATLKARAEYVMAFTATPVKPRPDNWRAFNDGNPRIAKGSTGSIGGWSSFYDALASRDTTTPASHVPRDPVAYKGSPSETVYPYSMPAQLGSNEAEYDYFVRTWAKIPAHLHHLKKGGTEYTLQPCCGNTEIADLMAWRIDDFFKKYPSPGFYYDVGGAGFCENREHGHGGVDVFGQPYVSSTAWGLRQYLQRVYKIHKRHGKTFFYHNHSYFNPVCHVFTDYFYPGEQYCRQSADYERFYCEGISLEEYQSELNSFIKGVGLVFLPQYERSTTVMPSMRHMRKEFQTNPEWTLRMLTPLLLHDLNVSASWCDRKVTIPKWWGIKDGIKLPQARFTGYWDKPAVKSASEKVLVSVYSWKEPSPYRHLFVVGNLGAEERPMALELDPAAFGIRPDSVFTELWSGETLTAGQLKTGMLKGRHFKLIAIR